MVFVAKLNDMLEVLSRVPGTDDEIDVYVHFVVFQFVNDFFDARIAVDASHSLVGLGSTVE